MRHIRSLIVYAVIPYSIALALLFWESIASYRTQTFRSMGMDDIRLNFLFLQWPLDWLRGNVAAGTQGLFDFYIFFPLEDTLAYSSNLLGSLPLVWLLDLFEPDLVARGNLWIFLCFFFNALSAYGASYFVLTRPSTRVPVGSAAGVPVGRQPPGGTTGSQATLSPFVVGLFCCLMGFCFAFSLPRLHYALEAGHLQLLPHFAAPWFLAFAYCALKQGSWRFSLCASMFCVWQTYLDIHLALLTLMVASGLYLLLLLIDVLNGESLWSLLSSHLRQLAVFAASFGLGVSPLVAPYVRTARLTGGRGLEELHFFSPDFGHWIRLPGQMQTLYTSFLPSLENAPGELEKIIFPGFLFAAGLLLWAGYCVRLLRRGIGSDRKAAVRKDLARSLLGLLPLGMLAGYIFPSVVQTLIYHHVPGFTSIRTPARSSIFLLPIVMLWLIWIYSQLPRSSWWARKTPLLLTLAIAFSCIELQAVEVQTRDNHFVRDLGDLGAVLRRCPGPAIVLPYGHRTLDVMHAAALYRLEIGNGYSGWLPSRFERLVRRQHTTPPRVLISQLHDQGYQCIVVSRAHVPSFRNETRPAVERVGNYLRY